MGFWSNINAAFAYADTLGLVVTRSGLSYAWTLPASELSITSSNVYWVNPTSGNDTTGDGSEGTPYKTINKAVAQHNTDAVSDAIVRISAGTHHLAAKWTTVPDMPLQLEGETAATVISRFVEATAGTWSLSGTNYYNATFAGMGLASGSGRCVFDTVNMAGGLTDAFTLAADNTENDAIEGSFRPGSSSINCHAVGGGEPGSGIFIADADYTMIDIAATGKVVVCNLTIYGAIDLIGSAGDLRLVDIAHSGGGQTGGTPSNGIYIGHTGSPNAILCRVVSAGNMGDAVNYESTTQVIELDCTFANSGYTTAISDNGSTLHDTASCISVNPTVTNCLRNVHDVNATHRMLINPTINTSRAASVAKESVNLMVGSTGGDTTEAWLIDGDISGGALDDLVVNSACTLNYWYADYAELDKIVDGTSSMLSENPIPQSDGLLQRLRYAISGIGIGVVR